MWNFTKFQLNQTTNIKNENKKCLNKLRELKFCEVSGNSFSNRRWKFQLSIIKNKKVLFLKKNFLSRTTKIHPKNGVCRLNFPEGFDLAYLEPIKYALESKLIFLPLEFKCCICLTLCAFCGTAMSHWESIQVWLSYRNWTWHIGYGGNSYLLRFLLRII